MVVAAMSILGPCYMGNIFWHLLASWYQKMPVVMVDRAHGVTRSCHLRTSSYQDRDQQPLMFACYNFCCWCLTSTCFPQTYHVEMLQHLLSTQNLSSLKFTIHTVGWHGINCSNANIEASIGGKGTALIAPLFSTNSCHKQASNQQNTKGCLCDKGFCCLATTWVIGMTQYLLTFRDW